MPIPQSATDAIEWFDHCNSSGDWSGSEQFALSVNAVTAGAHRATAPSEVKLLSTALFIAAVGETLSSPSHRVVVTPAGRDALVAMCEYATTYDAVESLAKALAFFFTTAAHLDSDEMLLTSPVRNALVALAKYAATPMAVGYTSRAFRILLPNATRLFRVAVIATTSVRDALVAMSRFATTPATVQSLCFAVEELMNAVNCEASRSSNKHLTDFVTPSMIDAIISMAQFSSTVRTVLVWLKAFALSTSIFLRLDLTRQIGSFGAASRREFHGAIANKRVCDAIISLSKFATAPEAIENLASTIYVFVCEVDSCSTFFANEAFRDAFVMMAPLATSRDASYLLADAMLAIVERVPQSVVLFACVEVMRGCGVLHCYANAFNAPRDSADQLLNRFTTYLDRRVVHAKDNRLSRIVLRDAVEMLSQCVGAAVEACQQRDLTQIMNLAIPCDLREPFGFDEDDEHTAPTTSHLVNQTNDHACLPHHFAAVAVDLIYTVSPTLSLSRAPKAAMLSSGGCRQGQSLGLLAINATLLHSLSQHVVFAGVARPAVLLQCFFDETTVIDSSLANLYDARVVFFRFFFGV